jgi:hypothetical protein
VADEKEKEAKKKAEEQARKKEAEEQARKEAEEQARKEAEDEANENPVDSSDDSSDEECSKDGEGGEGKGGSITGLNIRSALKKALSLGGSGSADDGGSPGGGGGSNGSTPTKGSKRSTEKDVCSPEGGGDYDENIAQLPILHFLEAKEDEEEGQDGGGGGGSAGSAGLHSEGVEEAKKEQQEQQEPPPTSPAHEPELRYHERLMDSVASSEKRIRELSAQLKEARLVQKQKRKAAEQLEQKQEGKVEGAEQEDQGEEQDPVLEVEQMVVQEGVKCMAMREQLLLAVQAEITDLDDELDLATRRLYVMESSLDEATLIAEEKRALVVFSAELVLLRQLQSYHAEAHREQQRRVKQQAEERVQREREEARSNATGLAGAAVAVGSWLWGGSTSPKEEEKEGEAEGGAEQGSLRGSVDIVVSAAHYGQYAAANLLDERELSYAQSAGTEGSGRSSSCGGGAAAVGGSGSPGAHGSTRSPSKHQRSMASVMSSISHSSKQIEHQQWMAPMTAVSSATTATGGDSDTPNSPGESKKQQQQQWSPVTLLFRFDEPVTLRAVTIWAYHNPSAHSRSVKEMRVVLDGEFHPKRGVVASTTGQVTVASATAASSASIVQLKPVYLHCACNGQRIHLAAPASADGDKGGARAADSVADSVADNVVAQSDTPSLDEAMVCERVGLVLLTNHGDKRFIGLSHVCFEYDIDVKDSSRTGKSVCVQRCTSKTVSLNTPQCYTDTADGAGADASTLPAVKETAGGEAKGAPTPGLTDAAPTSPSMEDAGLGKKGLSLSVDTVEEVSAPPVPPSPIASDDGYNSGWDEVESGSFM